MMKRRAWAFGLVLISGAVWSGGGLAQLQQTAMQGEWTTHVSRFGHVFITVSGVNADNTVAGSLKITSGQVFTFASKASDPEKLADARFVDGRLVITFHTGARYELGLTESRLNGSFRAQGNTIPVSFKRP